MAPADELKHSNMLLIPKVGQLSLLTVLPTYLVMKTYVRFIANISYK